MLLGSWLGGISCETSPDIRVTCRQTDHVYQQFLRGPAHSVRDHCFEPCDILLVGRYHQSWPYRWYLHWRHHRIRVS